jgi:hypothetical protein
MTPITYYKNPNLDYENYNEELDVYQVGYNVIGFDKLTLVNMVWEGPERINEHGGKSGGMRYYFLIDDTGEFYTSHWEEFCDITMGWYTNTPVELSQPSVRRTPEEFQNFKFFR